MNEQRSGNGNLIAQMICVYLAAAVDDIVSRWLSRVEFESRKTFELIDDSPYWFVNSSTPS